MASVEQAISEKLCAGCGACSFADPDAFRMGLTREGWMMSHKIPGATEAPETRNVCPFSGEAANETEIAASLWPDLPVNSQIGRHADSIACHVTDDAARLASGSGGFTTWLAVELLRRGDVDAVAHVLPVDSTEGALFRFAISHDEAGLRAGAKSRYYAVTMAEVLRQIAESGKRFAIVAVPCFARAVRLLIREGKLDAEGVPHVIGLVCGHMKSRHFAEYLAWQKEVAPGTLTGFDFRAKLMDRRASDYGFRLVTATRDEVHPMASVRGRDWGEGSFKVLACEYCDDVMAECADVAVGDAWLPGYVDDPRGCNVVVIRHPRIARIINEGQEAGTLAVTPLSVADVVQSQASGLRHRREGLAHRLARRAAAGKWSPAKRVEPALALTRQRRRIYDLRLEITLRSAEAFPRAREAGDILLYENEMASLIRRLQKATRGNSLQQRIRNLGRRLRNLRRRPTGAG